MARVASCAAAATKSSPAPNLRLMLVAAVAGLQTLRLPYLLSCLAFLWRSKILLQSGTGIDSFNFLVCIIAIEGHTRTGSCLTLLVDLTMRMSCV